MRSALLLAVILAAGCSPDYENTSFKCDADHLECPDGQACDRDLGICRASELVIDAPDDDDAPHSSSSVTCGSAGICPNGTQCCVDGDNARCGAFCNGGEITAMCDDKADCNNSALACCNFGTLTSCQNAFACGNPYCASNADCGGGTPHCCPDPETPFKTCVDTACP